MPPAKRKSAARDREQTKRQHVLVALQVGDRVSVETRAWGNGYARLMHGGRYLKGRTLGTVVGEADGKVICNFGEEQEDGQHAAWEATALLRVQTVDEVLAYLQLDTRDEYAKAAAVWLENELNELPVVEFWS